jgi:hypothetical protein
VADPQSATLARIMPIPEADIRDLIAFLIAGLVETGSALGFTFMVLAKRFDRQVQKVVKSARRPPAKKDPAQKPRRTPSATAKAATPGKSIIQLDDTPADHITRWTCARLDILKAGRIQANAAYADFKAWCGTEGIASCSPQMFGRRFTEVVESMGGRKVRINGRAFYEGVTLQETSVVQEPRQLVPQGP